MSHDENPEEPQQPHFLTGIHRYLASLSPQTLRRLFDTPSTCLAIFRLLTASARSVILSLLWLDHPLSLAQLTVLARKSEGKRHLESALQSLDELHIIDTSASVAGAKSSAASDRPVVLDESFRRNFRLALTGGGSHSSFGVPDQQQDGSVDVPFLDEYANTQWETILHFMVGSNLLTKPSPTVLDLLSRAGLVTPQTSRTLEKAHITSKGFQYLLQDTNQQLWDLLLNFLDLAGEREMDMVEVLSFLFMLGTLELGKAYSTSFLSRAQVQLLANLADYGMIYRQSANAAFFYPTRMATTLTSSAPPLVSAHHANEEKGFLVVETNYRVYAYTSNPLQIAVINLFVALKTRFPNMVVGQLTRESVKSALNKGITADQIISYFTAHAHPQMRKQDPLLPPTVTDQVRLWENEKNRIQNSDGYLYVDFTSAADFKLVRDYAAQLGVIVWEASPSLPPPSCWKFFVTEEGHAPIRDFIRRRSQAATG